MWSDNNQYVLTGNPDTRELDLFHLVLAPSFACNLRCKHCYLPDHSSFLMPWEQTRDLIRQWAHVVDTERGPWGGVFHLKGGEPTTVAYFDEILAELRSTQLRFLMTTNGLCLEPPSLGLLRELRKRNAESVIVTISLDGGRAAEHDQLRGRGSFDRSWRTAEQLIEAGIPVHINFVLTRSNAPGFVSLLRQAQGRGVAQVNVLPFVRRGYGAALQSDWLSPIERFDMVQEIYETVQPSLRSLLAGSIPDLISQNGCQLSECIVGYAGLYYVLPDGETYSCPNLVHSDFSAGNISRETIADVHDRMKTSAFYERVPSFAVADQDLSCKGAVVGELRSGHNEEAREVRLLPVLAAANNTPATTRVSACFSRNI